MKGPPHSIPRLSLHKDCPDKDPQLHKQQVGQPLASHCVLPEPALSRPRHCPLPKYLGPISSGIFPKMITPSLYFSSLPLRRVAFSLSGLYLIPEDSEIYLVLPMPFNEH